MNKIAQNHPANIKAQICVRVGSLTALAKQAGIHYSTISAALKRPQPVGNRAIAKCLDKSVHELWPNWYDYNGDRIFTQNDVSRFDARPSSQKNKGVTDMKVAS